jgi:DNA-binding transcriptional LysR family regulator
MEMRHLRYFVALAEQRNFRRAAERLGIAQPPLSRQIRALERELGCRLVLRTSRGVQLTAAGRAFLEQARITLAEAQRAVDRARVAAPESADALVVGCEGAARLAVVGRALGRFTREHPAVRLELRDEEPARIVSALRDGLVQAAIVALPLADAGDGLAIERIASVPLCLAVRVGHPLAGPRPVTWRRLAEEPFVLYERDAAPSLYDLVTGAFQTEGIVLRPRHRATALSSALTLVEAGLGVTVLPSGWQPSRSFGVTCRSIRRPSVSLSFGIAYRRGANGVAIDGLVHAARAAMASVTAEPSRLRTRSSTEAVS